MSNSQEESSVQDQTLEEPNKEVVTVSEGSTNVQSSKNDGGPHTPTTQPSVPHQDTSYPDKYEYVDNIEQHPRSVHSSKSRDDRFKHSPLKRNPSAKSPVKSRPTTTRTSNNKRHNSPTKSIAPRFDSVEELERRRQHREARAHVEKVKTEQINSFRNSQRVKLKQGYEIEREKIIAQEELYKKKRALQWRKRLSKSPFSVDLVADTERVQEEHSVKRMVEAKKKVAETKKLNELKSNMIMNQLMEAQRRSEMPSNTQRRFRQEINVE